MHCFSTHLLPHQCSIHNYAQQNISTIKVKQHFHIIGFNRQCFFHTRNMTILLSETTFLAQKVSVYSTSLYYMQCQVIILAQYMYVQYVPVGSMFTIVQSVHHFLHDRWFQHGTRSIVQYFIPIVNTVKPVNKDHSRDCDLVILIGRWSDHTG